MDRAEIALKLAASGYIAGPELSMAMWLMELLGRPLLIEGEAGVGKTAVAAALAGAHATALIRLQCYEGLDASAALYEWNYQRQLLSIKARETSGEDAREIEKSIFSEEYLLERPLLAAIRQEKPPVLLIDEIDRADEEFEALLLEVLSDFQVTIPEFGTLTARSIPRVILTSNATRELSDALRRRCLYHYLDYPSEDQETRILMARLPGMDALLPARSRSSGAGAQGGHAKGAGCRRIHRLGGVTSGARHLPTGTRVGGASRIAAMPGQDPGGPGSARSGGGRASPGQGGVMESISPQGLGRRMVGFARMLRDNGFQVGPDQVADALRASRAIDLSRPGQLRLALRPVLATRREEARRFAELFDAYWLRRGVRSATRVSSPTHDRPARRIPFSGGIPGNLAAFADRVERTNASDADVAADPGSMVRRAGASSTESLARTDFRFLDSDESRAEIERLADKLALSMRRRLRRRQKSARRGERLDLRRMLRPASRMAESRSSCSDAVQCAVRCGR
jgi:hypothetical protein